MPAPGWGQSTVGGQLLPHHHLQAFADALKRGAELLEDDGEDKKYKDFFLKRVLGSIRNIKKSHEVEVINASLPHAEVALAIKNSILAKT